MSKSKLLPRKKQSIVLAETSQPGNTNMIYVAKQSLSINMEYLSDIINGDEELQKELVGLYLCQMTGDLVKLKKALSMRDGSEVKQLAHRMIGGSAACGIMTLVESLRKLEYLAEEGQLTKIPSILSQVENQFMHTSLFLQELISAPAH
jgi:HPt (histidine-containing phosphotransfer) domain-containing protein